MNGIRTLALSDGRVVTIDAAAVDKLLDLVLGCGSSPELGAPARGESGVISTPERRDSFDNG